MTKELLITIRNGTATAELNGNDYGSIELKYTGLTRDTIEVLKEWLARWHAFKPGTVVDKTYEVLGLHLYKFLFHDEVADALRTGLREAEEAHERLRVILKVPDDDTEIAHLPWEFLYYDGGESGTPFYLATDGNLMLNRTVALKAPRQNIDPAEPPLRILVIRAVLKVDANAEGGAWTVEKALDRLERKGLAEDGTPPLEVHHLCGWNMEEIRKELQDFGPHVVHFVGTARYRERQTEIHDPDLNGRGQWRPAEELVVNLTEGAGASGPPQLVFLHLRGARDDEFTATFERLAPALIRRRVPLVLAMQYPMPDQTAETFLNKFYKCLAAGEEFDVAVQESRKEIRLGPNTARDLGTPVLYMHAKDSRLVRPTTVERQTYEPEARRVNTTGNITPSAVRERLLEKTWEVATTEGDVEIVQKWIRGTEWSTELRANQDLIRLQMLEDSDIGGKRGRVYLELLRMLASTPGG